MRSCFRKFTRAALPAALLLAGALCAAPMLSTAARAGDFASIDCAETSLHFAAPGYEVNCRHLADTDSDGIGRRIDEISIVHGEDGAYLDLVDARYDLAYLDRTGVQADVTNYYDDSFQDGWQETGPQAGYDMAEYRGHDDSGRQTDCIAFRRYVNFKEGGVSRLVAGHGCAPIGGRDKLYEALKGVAAPGA